MFPEWSAKSAGGESFSRTGHANVARGENWVWYSNILLHDVGKKMEQGDKQKPAKLLNSGEEGKCKKMSRKIGWQEVYYIVYKKIMHNANEALFGKQVFFFSVLIFWWVDSIFPKFAGWYPRACHLRVRKHRNRVMSVVDVGFCGISCVTSVLRAMPEVWREFHWKGVLWLGWNMSCQKDILKCWVFLGMKLVTYMAFVWDCDNFIWFLDPVCGTRQGIWMSKY